MRDAGTVMLQRRRAGCSIKCYGVRPAFCGPTEQTVCQTVLES